MSDILKSPLLSPGMGMDTLAQENTLVGQFGIELAAARQMEDVADILQALTGKFWEWDAFFLSIKKTGRTRFITLRSIDTIAGEKREVPPRDYDASETAFAAPVLEGKGVLLNRDETNETPEEGPYSYLARPSASLMFAPVRLHGLTVAILSIQSYKQWRFAEGDLNLLQRLADAVAPVIERFRLERLAVSFFALGKRLNTTRTPYEAARVVADVSDELLGWDAFSLDLFSEKTEEIFPILSIDLFEGGWRELLPEEHGRPEPAVMRRSINKGAQLLLRGRGDLENVELTQFGSQRKSASLMFVPIHGVADISGMLTIQSYTSDAYDLDDLEILKSLAEHCGGALERTVMQKELFRSNARYETLLNATDDYIYVVGPDMRFQQVNRTPEKRYGISNEQRVGKTIGEIAGEEAANVVEPHIRHVFSTGESRNFEDRAVIQGEEFYAETRLNPILGPDGKVEAVVGVSRDVTVRKRQEKIIRHREAILEAVAFIAGQLVGSQNWQSAMPAVLGRLGTSVQTGRAYVFRFDRQSADELFASQLHEWTARGVPPMIDNPSLQNFPIRGSGFGRWEKLLFAGEPVFGFVRDFPEKERVVFEAQQILSLLAVPIFVRGECWGFIGFDEVVEERVWTLPEIEALRTAAQTLGAAIQQQRTEEAASTSLRQIEVQLQQLNAQRAMNMAVVSESDCRASLSVILEHILQQLGVDAACILLYNPQTDLLEFAAQIGFYTQALQGAKLRLGQSYAGRAASTKSIVIIPDMRYATRELLTPSVQQEAFVTYVGAPLMAKGRIQGVLEVFSRTALDIDDRWKELFEALSGNAAVAIDNLSLFENLQRTHLDLIAAYDTTLEGWVRALDLRDRETEGHTQRVTETSVRLASALGIENSELQHVRRGALLHDIGKMGIPDSILLKSGPLTEEEWTIMRKHPVYAYELLEPISHLRPALNIPHYHHEKWDGSGYPAGLKREEIPYAARIFAVVDIWDALRSDRPYRRGWPEDKVREHITNLAGTHLDPAVVNMFLQLEF